MPPDPIDRLNAALAGRYTVVRELGRGAMAVVYLAEDAKHGRQVAVKVLRDELGESLAADRFLREIRIAAALSHPNIVPVYDSGAGDGLLWYAMPAIEGESLRARLSREKQLPIPDALRIAREVADALAYAHAHGVVHRDIKPENILLVGGHALVADFGIARAVTRSASDRITETGLAVGTPAYMSPEQATGADDVDARTDQYALGCVTYEMLAGAPPYAAPTTQALLARKVLEPVPAIRIVRDTVPPAVEAAVTRAMAKVPADRFADTREFAAALGGDGAAPAAASPSRRWRLALAGGAALLVIAVGARLAWRAVRASPRVPETLAVRQITSDPGIESYPAWAPDGQWIAYAGDAQGERDILLRRVDGENAIDLTKDSRADNDEPVFSPDGERIAFRSERDGGGIFLMGRTGEAVRRLTREGHRPTWSPDGRAIAYASEGVRLSPRNETIRSTISVVTLATGATRPLTTDDAVMPAWSPHGARIAYVRRDLEQGMTNIAIVPAAGGAAVAVTAGKAIDWGPAWSPDGRWIYFASDRGGSTNLWRIAVDEASGRPSGAPEPVTTPAPSVAAPAVSPDGRRIAYAAVDVRINVQRVAFDPASASVQGQPTWLTTGSRAWSSPDPSPDGRWVTMYGLGPPEGKVYVVRTDGSGLRQVMSDSAIERAPRWSPDGAWIGFFSNREGGFEPWKVRSDGSELTLMMRISSGPVSWSPDGARAAVTSFDSAARVIVFDSHRRWDAQRADTLPAAPAAMGLFDVNAWSSDGRWLTGTVGVGDSGIAVYSMASRSYTMLAPFGIWPVFLPDSRRILFVAGGKAFYVVDRVSRAVRKVFSVDRDVIGPPRLSKDGRMLFYSRRVTEADIWVAALK